MALEPHDVPMTTTQGIREVREGPLVGVPRGGRNDRMNEPERGPAEKESFRKRVLQQMEDANKKSTEHWRSGTKNELVPKERVEPLKDYRMGGMKLPSGCRSETRDQRNRPEERKQEHDVARGKATNEVNGWMTENERMMQKDPQPIWTQCTKEQVPFAQLLGCPRFEEAVRISTPRWKGKCFVSVEGTTFRVKGGCAQNIPFESLLSAKRKGYSQKTHAAWAYGEVALSIPWKEEVFAIRFPFSNLGLEAFRNAFGGSLGINWWGCEFQHALLRERCDPGKPLKDVLKEILNFLVKELGIDLIFHAKWQEGSLLRETANETGFRVKTVVWPSLRTSRPSWQLCESLHRFCGLHGPPTNFMKRKRLCPTLFCPLAQIVTFHTTAFGAYEERRKENTTRQSGVKKLGAHQNQGGMKVNEGTKGKGTGKEKDADWSRNQADGNQWDGEIKSKATVKKEKTGTERVSVERKVSGRDHPNPGTKRFDHLEAVTQKQAKTSANRKVPSTSRMRSNDEEGEMRMEEIVDARCESKKGEGTEQENEETKQMRPNWAFCKGDEIPFKLRGCPTLEKAVRITHPLWGKQCFVVIDGAPFRVNRGHGGGCIPMPVFVGRKGSGYSQGFPCAWAFGEVAASFPWRGETFVISMPFSNLRVENFRKALEGPLSINMWSCEHQHALLQSRCDEGRPLQEVLENLLQFLIRDLEVDTINFVGGHEGQMLGSVAAKMGLKVKMVAQRALEGVVPSWKLCGRFEEGCTLHGPPSNFLRTRGLSQFMHCPMAGITAFHTNEIRTFSCHGGCKGKLLGLERKSEKEMDSRKMDPQDIGDQGRRSKMAEGEETRSNEMEEQKEARREKIEMEGSGGGMQTTHTFCRFLSSRFVPGLFSSLPTERGRNPTEEKRKGTQGPQKEAERTQESAKATFSYEEEIKRGPDSSQPVQKGNDPQDETPPGEANRRLGMELEERRKEDTEQSHMMEGANLVRNSPPDLAAPKPNGSNNVLEVSKESELEVEKRLIASNGNDGEVKTVQLSPCPTPCPKLNQEGHGHVDVRLDCSTDSTAAHDLEKEKGKGADSRDGGEEDESRGMVQREVNSPRDPEAPKSEGDQGNKDTLPGLGNAVHPGEESLPLEEIEQGTKVTATPKKNPQWTSAGEEVVLCLGEREETLSNRFDRMGRGMYCGKTAPDDHPLARQLFQGEVTKQKGGRNKGKEGDAEVKTQEGGGIEDFSFQAPLPEEDPLRGGEETAKREEGLTSGKNRPDEPMEIDNEGSREKETLSEGHEREKEHQRNTPEKRKEREKEKGRRENRGGSTEEEGKRAPRKTEGDLESLEGQMEAIRELMVKKMGSDVIPIGAEGRVDWGRMNSEIRNQLLFFNKIAAKFDTLKVNPGVSGVPIREIIGKPKKT